MRMAQRIHGNARAQIQKSAAIFFDQQVMFASTGEKPDQNGTKDSVANIRETGVFCVNIVEHAMIGQMNASAATLPYDTNEYEQAGLQQIACNIINCARVSGAPAALECKLTQIVNLPGAANFAVFGEVIGVHMREDCIENGRFDVTKFKPLTRLGYRDYAIIEKTFELARPDEGKHHLRWHIGHGIEKRIRGKVIAPLGIAG